MAAFEALYHDFYRSARAKGYTRRQARRIGRLVVQRQKNAAVRGRRDQDEARAQLAGIITPTVEREIARCHVGHGSHGRNR